MSIIAIIYQNRKPEWPLCCKESDSHLWKKQSKKLPISSWFKVAIIDVHISYFMCHIFYCDTASHCCLFTFTYQQQSTSLTLFTNVMFDILYIIKSLNYSAHIIMFQLSTNCETKINSQKINFERFKANNQGNRDNEGTKIVLWNTTCTFLYKALQKSWTSVNPGPLDLILNKTNQCGEIWMKEKSQKLIDISQKVVLLAMQHMVKRDVMYPVWIWGLSKEWRLWDSCWRKD